MGRVLSRCNCVVTPEPILAVFVMQKKTSLTVGHASRRPLSQGLLVAFPSVEQPLSKPQE